jgi:hypothetical protein
MYTIWQHCIQQSLQSKPSRVSNSNHSNLSVALVVEKACLIINVTYVLLFCNVRTVCRFGRFIKYICKPSDEQQFMDMCRFYKKTYYLLIMLAVPMCLQMFISTIKAKFCYGMYRCALT